MNFIFVRLTYHKYNVSRRSSRTNRLHSMQNCIFITFLTPVPRLICAYLERDQCRRTKGQATF